MGELGQQLRTRLDRLEQPHRRGPVRNQNSNPEDEDGDNETMPSLEEDDPHINRHFRKHDPIRNHQGRDVQLREQNKDIKLVPPNFPCKSSPEVYME